MLAGAPAMLDVVALRVEEPAPEPEVAAAATEAAPPPAGQAAAAPLPATSAAPDAPPAADTAETLIAMPQAEPAPRRPGFFGRVFGRREAPAEADPGIETSVLDPVDMAQAPAPSPTPQPTPMPSPVASPAPAPAPAQTAASSLDRPYIQLGIFSVEANARNAERMARGADLPARVVAGQSQGNQFWRVVVGPAADAAAQRQMLARIKALGFNDAYAVRR
jgi:cell division septation protein DedD